MADRLAPFLREGETLLYRAPEEVPEIRWRTVLAIGGVGFGFALLMNSLLGPMPEGGQAALATMLLASAILLFNNFVMRRDVPLAAVTDRRLLCVSEKGEGLEKLSVDREEIAEVALCHDAFRVMRTDGEHRVFAVPYHAPALAEALARAGFPVVPPVPRAKIFTLEDGLGQSLMFGGFLAWVLGFFPIWGSAAGLPAACAAVVVWWLLGGLAGLALLRPALTWAEMRGLVLRSKVLFLGPGDPARPGPLRRFYLGIVDLLYAGQAARREAEEDGNGG